MLDIGNVFNSKPGQTNNSQAPANNPFLDSNQVICNAYSYSIVLSIQILSFSAERSKSRKRSSNPIFMAVT